MALTNLKSWFIDKFRAPKPAIHDVLGCTKRFKTSQNEVNADSQRLPNATTAQPQNSGLLTPEKTG